MPLARAQLDRWTKDAESIKDATLREQALLSLQHKRFHADGGSVYAAANPDFSPVLVELIIALQTISDYLDNLCDRCDKLDGVDFRQLHHSMRDAVVPDAPLRDYYRYRDTKDDGGYLNRLVQTCQSCVRQLPNYKAVQAQVSWYVERYSELQEHKHIEPSLRTRVLVDWSKPYVDKLADVEWWEFAAATGSTLGMFSLFLAATFDVDERTVNKVHSIYFPWICGLHILLDYLIDLDEDEQAGDFNFVACYENEKLARQRIQHFAHQSWQRCGDLPYGGKIHQYVVQGLLGMYLSDDKVRQQPTVKKARKMIYRFGPTTYMFYMASRFYRFVR